ncbi:7948_t:CDS:2 [Cetraspora pellucida]|uniref:7948_t:CDS:1 n=1 Tax=Cetraspora pellucida TaxID=1433469 RepID=A0A9N9JJG5_9GLOM|nr:7948_t:CDS:2 [Cetraspora pellucida]
MVNSFTHTQPKEVSINSYNMINIKFIILKDPVLNHFTSNFSDKEREKFWHKITMIFSHILQPISDLIQIASQQTNILPKTASEEIQPEAEILWPNPIEINFIHKIISNDVATITCQITSLSGKNIQVPGALIDSGANCSLKLKESIGTCYNVPITFGYGDNSCTITEDFPVMDDDKPWILLGTPLLDHAGWEPIVKHEFKLIHKGKVITIPLSVYKSQREIFKLEINLTFYKQDLVQVSTDSSSPSSKDNNVLLEEWHAPTGFSPDFSLSNSKSQCSAIKKK